MKQKEVKEARAAMDAYNKYSIALRGATSDVYGKFCLDICPQGKCRGRICNLTQDHDATAHSPRRDYPAHAAP